MREKFVPRGGPSGGDGGRGGDVIMESSQRHNTLIHFRYNPEHKAHRGQHGMGSNCSGSDGRSIVLQVPVGTSLYDQVFALCRKAGFLLGLAVFGAAASALEEESRVAAATAVPPMAAVRKSCRRVVVLAVPVP